jgi:hypothetical protein
VHAKHFRGGKRAVRFHPFRVDICISAFQYWARFAQMSMGGKGLFASEPCMGVEFCGGKVSALAGVKLCHSTIKIQENSLCNVLSLKGIAHNFQCDAEHKFLITVEKDSEGVVPAFLETSHQVLVRQPLKLRLRQLVPLPNGGGNGIRVHLRLPHTM